MNCGRRGLSEHDDGKGEFEWWSGWWWTGGWGVDWVEGGWKGWKGQLVGSSVVGG